MWMTPLSAWAAVAHKPFSKFPLRRREFTHLMMCSTWLLLKEQEKTGSISLMGFYRRRALRIFPAFYAFWIVAVGSRLLAHGEAQVPWSQAFSAFFYVSNYFHAIFHPSPDFIIHTWSLSAAFDTRADALLVGCFLALVLKEGLAQR